LVSGYCGKPTLRHVLLYFGEKKFSEYL
jgi:hypothetical protein